jgi:hypothetical protein
VGKAVAEKAAAEKVAAEQKSKAEKVAEEAVKKAESDKELQKRRDFVANYESSVYKPKP